MADRANLRVQRLLRPGGPQLRPEDLSACFRRTKARTSSDDPVPAAFCKWVAFGVDPGSSLALAAITTFIEHRPDVTLLDLRLPSMSGHEVLTAIRAHDPHARVVVLTTFSEREDVHRALEAGAQAYLLKGTPRDELLDAIRAVHAGQRRIPTELAKQLVEDMGQCELTKRELQVLQLIAQGASTRAFLERVSIRRTGISCSCDSIRLSVHVSSRHSSPSRAFS